MAYCLQKDETVSDGVKRIAAEQIRAASCQLHSGEGLEKRVHEARKSLKKARALLRLVKADLGPAYLEENRRMRDIGRRISELRDAHVTIEVFDDFTKKHGLKRRLAPVRAALEESRVELERRSDWARQMELSSFELTAAEKRVEDWPIKSRGLSDFEKALNNSYRRARAAFSAAQAEGTPDQFHELRKRTKTHLNQLRIVEQITGGRWHNRITELDALSDCLGQQHNLVVLSERFPQGREPADLAGQSMALAQREQKRLEARALVLADKLYARNPKEFWRDVPAGGRAAASKKPENPRKRAGSATEASDAAA